MSPRALSFLIAAGATGLFFSTGCDTDAFCFADCGETAPSNGTGTASGGGDSTGSFNTGGSMGAFTTADTTGSGPCTPTNAGIEICDGVDQDCNGVIDDIPGIDYAGVETCGTCDNNCLNKLTFQENITCTPSPMPGEIPGVCEGDCIPDYFDFDANPDDCETFCQATSTTDTICNNKDDDCDGTVDDEVDLCTTTDCGSCGVICVAANAMPVCAKLDQNPCGPNNMQCQIPVGGCDPGWVDLDGLYSTGCEYPCTPDGVEVCGDQLDNDCDGLIDAADDLSMDPQIGVTCVGDPDGICSLPAHSGLTSCVNGQVACVGPNVLFEDDTLEVCNGADDDCDGQADDNPTDEGASCGVSPNYPCTLGTFQCVGGALDCVGDINPGTEICNGVDDNCDGQIDLTNGQPPADSVGTCNVPIPPPAGATSPCTAGTKACVGGVIDCVGDNGPSAAVDQCGDDSNCDGTLNNQPNFQTDVTHCGNCATNCQTGAVNAIWTCTNGGCVFVDCLPGWEDLNNDQQCEYPCNFVSAQEACNNQDDNCNGQVDEGVVAPSPSQVCGVAPGNTFPECTTQVQVACSGGNWQCTFPAGVCSPNCATAMETCDGLDNDCDGFRNENVPDFGQPCASDDGLPAPGHGACRTTGTKVCMGGGATTCSAVKANCALLPGGCTERCDEIDNDCDGLIDETYENKGTVPAHFYRPNVVQVGASLWIHQHEASRPDATNVIPGAGNGYWTSAPLGDTLDRTSACSEPSKIPWFNVNSNEVAQTCDAMGGFICSTQQWKDACRIQPGAGADCIWGYGPYGTGCRTATTPPVKQCNLGYFDFNTMLMGNQDGLLPTKSNLLGQCYADWQNLQGNGTGDPARIFDLTGNVREITQFDPSTAILMGGAFNSQAESGATCDFDFYAVENTFKFYDTGFRCCFNVNPTL